MFDSGRYLDTIYVGLLAWGFWLKSKFNVSKQGSNIEPEWVKH